MCGAGPSRIVAVAPRVAAAKIPSAGVDPPLVRSRMARQGSGGQLRQECACPRNAETTTSPSRRHAQPLQVDTQLTGHLPQFPEQAFGNWNAVL